MSSFQFIKDHKSIFTIIVLLQLVFFVSVSVILAAFTPPIVNSIESIMESVAGIDVTQAQFAILAQKPLLDDLERFESQFWEIQKNAALLVFFLALSYTLTHSCIWYLLARKFFPRLLVIAFIQGIGWMLLIFSFLSIAFVSAEINPLFFFPLFIIGLSLLYFSPLGLVSSESSFKKMLREIVAVGINRWLKVLLVYCGIGFVYALIGLAFFIVLELHILILVIVLVFAIIVFAWTKIFQFKELTKLF